MQRFLIIFGIIAVGYLAVNDTIERFRELDVITVNTTPSQEEMKSKLMKSKGQGIQENYQYNRPNAQDFEMPKGRNNRMQNDVKDIKESITPKNLDINPNNPLK